MKDAVLTDGVECLGYTIWGCIDLASTSIGEIKKRCGLVHVDRNDEEIGSLRLRRIVPSCPQRGRRYFLRIGEYIDRLPASV
jgi:beta-glucosidase/6-phospho-beta-glucosidase/beta-galactosidase